LRRIDCRKELTVKGMKARRNSKGAQKLGKMRPENGLEQGRASCSSEKWFSLK
jgi:hypothetical protein